MITVMSNAEIYGLSKALNKAFNNEIRYLPAKVNFYIQKNKNTLAQLTSSIDKTRLNIVQHYGTLNPDGETYNFSPDNIPLANKELQELLSLQEEVNVKTIHLSDLEELEFTPSQMQALLFMIEED